MKTACFVFETILFLMLCHQNLCAENVIVISDGSDPKDALLEIPVTAEKDGDSLLIYSKEPICDVVLNGECYASCWKSNVTIDLSDKFGEQTIVVETVSGRYVGKFDAE